MFCCLYTLLVCNVIKAIKNLIPVRDTQAKRRVPNSPAIPLPSASFGSRIPLPASLAKDTQAGDLPEILAPATAHFGDQSALCPCRQGQRQGDGRSARPRLRRLDQHVDAAGGEGELAPGLVIDRHAVLDALGAGGPLRVAGDQRRL